MDTAAGIKNVLESHLGFWHKFGCIMPSVDIGQRRRRRGKRHEPEATLSVQVDRNTELPFGIAQDLSGFNKVFHLFLSDLLFLLFAQPKEQ